MTSGPSATVYDQSKWTRRVTKFNVIDRLPLKHKYRGVTTETYLRRIIKEWFALEQTYDNNRDKLQKR